MNDFLNLLSNRWDKLTVKQRINELLRLERDTEAGNERAKAAARKEPTVHDYTVRTWGHNYAMFDLKEDKKTATMIGWGHGLKKDDRLLLPSAENASESVMFEIDKVEYYRDPPDMWKITATFVPRYTCSVCKTTFESKKVPTDCINKCGSKQK